MTAPSLPTLQDVFRARRMTAGHVLRTPLVPSPALGRVVGAEVFLKLECLQSSGSFKVRGALNRILSLTPEERSRGLITFSTGNHG